MIFTEGFSEGKKKKWNENNSSNKTHSLSLGGERSLGNLCQNF